MDNAAFATMGSNETFAASEIIGWSKDPDVVLRTSYKALMALSEGEMTEQVFMQDHSQLEVHVPGEENDLFRLFSLILAVFKSS